MWCEFFCLFVFTDGEEPKKEQELNLHLFSFKLTALQICHPFIMLPTTTFILISVIITRLLFFVGQVLPQQRLDLQKSSPYECGFDPIKSSRLPFSFRFFLVALLFLLFDLEIAILLPLPISTLLIKSREVIFPLIIFLLVLTAGLIYEWINGGLDWAKN